MLQEGFITFFEIIKAILMGIVEGITEWLPISSTGHMILVETFLPFKATDVFTTDFMDMFNVVIQLGAILAVVTIYFNKLNPWAKGKSRQSAVQPSNFGRRLSSVVSRQA